MIFIHRFGALLNTRLHFHCIEVDGVFEGDAGGSVSFQPVTGQWISENRMAPSGRFRTVTSYSMCQLRSELIHFEHVTDFLRLQHHRLDL